MTTAVAALPLPPGPRSRFPGDQLLAIRKGRLEYFRQMFAAHGDVVRIAIGPRSIVLVSHPELIRDVLVTYQKQMGRGRGLARAKLMLGEGLLTSEGAFHLRQRRLSQPAFHRQRIAGYAATMAAYAERHRDRWRDGLTVDVHREMGQLTLAIAGKTLFDADVESDAQEIGEVLQTVFELFEFALLPFTELLDRLPIPPTIRFRRARARLDAIIYRIIAERRASGEDRGDLLSMLMLASDDESDGGRMSDLQLRDEAMTLLLAGHETTASALTYAWQMLARNPDAERKMHDEIATVLGGRTPTADDVPRLPYTRMVVAETLRLYPSAWVLGYRALEPVELGGYRVPRDALILMSQYVVQRDSRWWPDPERFAPERWTTPDPERPKLAYFPFGAGPRQCIGEQFAWMEAVLVLATFAQRWRLTTADASPPPVRAGFTLRPPKPVEMVVRALGSD